MRLPSVLGPKILFLPGHTKRASNEKRLTSISPGPRAKASGKLLVRMMRGEAGKHMKPTRPHQPTKKGPAIAGLPGGRNAVPKGQTIS
jgi:hypothetical protein